MKGSGRCKTRSTECTFPPCCNNHILKFEFISRGPLSRRLCQFSGLYSFVYYCVWVWNCKSPGTESLIGSTSESSFALLVIVPDQAEDVQQRKRQPGAD